MSQLVKAQLISTDGGGTIEFMFNPNQLAFNQQINLTKSSGARTGRGLPKVNFAYPEPVILTINDLIFDTYERGESVLKYIKSFQKAVDFAESGAGREKRPPTYVFTWGSQKYIRCFVTKLDYNLTMFLPDGTPVRAKINLTLEEIDESISQPGMSTPKSNASQRQQDSLSSRKARLKSGSGASSPPLSPSPQAAPSASSLTTGGLGGAANAASQAASQASDAASQAANAASQAASQAANAASQAASQASDAASQAASQASDAASQAASQVSDAASQAADTVSQAASQASDAASQAASQASDAASQAASQAADAASQAASQASDAASQAASQASDAASQAASQASDAASQAASQLEE